MKAVLFDLFETLITERENGKNVWDFGTPECDCPADLLGINKVEFEREWALRRSDRMNGVFPDYYTVLKDICLTLNLAMDDEVLRYLDKRRVAAKRIPFQHIETSILDIIKGLKNKGCKVGVISNCSAEEVDGLFACPLVNFIDEMVFSFQVGVSKPHKEIYVLACERLQVKSTECIFVGDGGANELVGATNAGIKAYQAAWFHNRADISDEFQKVEDPMVILDFV